MTPGASAVAAVLLALAVVVAGVPAGVLGADAVPADAGSGDVATDGAGDAGTTGDESTTTGEEDGDEAPGEDDADRTGDASTDEADATAEGAGTDDGGDASETADGSTDADGSETVTLTYRDVEYRAVRADRGDGRVRRASPAPSPFGEPVDGDRYLVHVVLVDDDAAHGAALADPGAEVHLRVGRDVEAPATLETVDRLREASFVESVRPVQRLRPPDPRPPDRERLADDLRGAAGTVQAAATDGSVVSEGAARMGADRVHARGITGEGWQYDTVPGAGSTTDAFDDAPEPVAPVLDGRRSTDPDGDGVYEDVTGNGAFTLSDVTFLFEHRAEAALAEPTAYEFNGNGSFTLADVTALLGRLSP